MQQSDILEVRIYDASYQIFFKKKARIKDRKEMLELKQEMLSKGINLNQGGWFD